MLDSILTGMNGDEGDVRTGPIQILGLAKIMTRPLKSTTSGASFTSDFFQLQDPEQLARSLGRIFATFFLASVCLSVFSYFAHWPLTFDLAAGGSLGFFWVIILQRRGLMALASLIFLVELYLVSMLSMVLGDGCHDISIMLLPVTIIIGSFLLSTPYYWLLTGLAVASTSLMGFMELQGSLVNRFNGHWPPGDLFLLEFFLVGTAILMRLLAQVLEETLVRLHSSKRNYSEIFNATSDAIFIHDAATGTVIDVNDTMRQMFGFEDKSPEEIPFDAIHSEIPPFTTERGLELVKLAVNEGPQLFDWQGRHSDGRVFWVEVALSSTQIGGSNRVLAVVRDVDERKKIEERLRHAEKLEAVGRLAGGVAHDFNNQLTGIISYATFIQEDLGDQPELANAVGNILKAAGRAGDLTAKLMSLSRKEQSQDVIVDVNDLIVEVRDLLRHTLDPRITVTLKLEPNPALTPGDPSQLQNCLLNLALNARDAMPECGELIFATELAEIPPVSDCCEEFELAAGPYIQIIVRDTGCGMDEMVMRQIFDPFYTTKAKGLGTGLGLATVYRAIKNHQGCIEVSSEPGQGSQFRILLPRYQGTTMGDDGVEY